MAQINYIKDIPFKVTKSAIDRAPDGALYNAVIEISNGDSIKYEVHPDGHYLTAVRALNSIFKYPFSYGFIPQTLAEDGDGLDVIVITPEPLAHLSVIEVRVLGYVSTIDCGKVDNKLIAVPAYSTLRRVSMDKVMAFLKNYKYPSEDTTVGEFVGDSSKAEQLIFTAHEAFVKVDMLSEPIESPVAHVLEELKVVAPKKEDTPIEQHSTPLQKQEEVKEKAEEVREEKPEPFSEEAVQRLVKEKTKINWLS